MSQFIRIYTVYHSVFEFRPRSLFTAVDMCKFKHGLEVTTELRGERNNFFYIFLYNSQLDIQWEDNMNERDITAEVQGNFGTAFVTVCIPFILYQIEFQMRKKPKKKKTLQPNVPV